MAQVSLHCGNITDYKSNGNRIVSLRKKLNDSPSRDLANSDLYLTVDSQNADGASIGNLLTAADINKSLIFVRGNLSDTKNYLGNVPYDLCANDKLAASDDEQNKCWNGTNLGRSV